MMQKLKNAWPALVISLAVLAAFYPSFVLGKIPLNGNNLVSFFSPWIYEKWPGYPAGVPAKPGILDQLRIYYPYMKLTQASYRLGQLPLWNPHNFAGNPHMAEWQSGVFYPLHILLPFLPLPVYWTLYQISAFFLAGLFTYLYLSNLRLNKLASLFGGLTFSLSSFMFTWNAEVITATHSILWLPAMWLLVDKFLSLPKWKYWFLLIVSGTFSVLSGYWQTTFYAFLATGAYILFRCFILPPKTNHQTKPFKQASLLILVFPLIAGLTLFHLLPTWELYNRSSRPQVNLSAEILSIHKGYLLKGKWLITLLVPDFFGHPTTRNQAHLSKGSFYEWAIFTGTAPIMLLPLLLFIQEKRQKKFISFLTLLAVFAGSLSFDLPHSRFMFDAKIPVLSTGIANRILYLPAFSIAILSSIGFNRWLKISPSNRRQATFKTAMAGLMFFVGLWLVLAKVAPSLAYDPLKLPHGWVKTAIRNSVIPSLVFLSTASLLTFGAWRSQWLMPVASLLVLGSTLQNLYQFHKFTPFTEARFVYPSHPAIDFLQQNAGINRYLGYNGVFLNYNFATQFGLYTIEGYDSLNDRRRSALITSAQHQGDISQRLPRSADLTLSRDLTNPGVLRMMQLTGVKYLVDHPDYPDVMNKPDLATLPTDKQKLVFQAGDWKIYEYLDALPRAFLVGSYLLATNDQLTAFKVFDPAINLQKTVILNQVPPSVAPEFDPKAEVTVVSYTPNKIIFKTSSSKDQLLFLSDTYYPGWKAKIDGIKSSVMPANFAFRAVPVPQGNHTVEMYYLPDTFITGLIVASITSLLILTAAKLKFS